ncbi:MAG: hypothetical protein QOI92_1303 [Chloroflexota bacterium]|nr:hypothetical protein [Chloroflexota bacterium]
MNGGRLGSGSGVKSGAPSGELGGVGRGGAESFGVASIVAWDGFGGVVGEPVPHAATFTASRITSAAAECDFTAAAQSIVQYGARSLHWPPAPSVYAAGWPVSAAMLPSSRYQTICIVAA